MTIVNEQFNWVNYMIYELYFNKATLKIAVDEE